MPWMILMTLPDEGLPPAGPSGSASSALAFLDSGACDRPQPPPPDAPAPPPGPDGPPAPLDAYHTPFFFP